MDGKMLRLPLVCTRARNKTWDQYDGFDSSEIRKHAFRWNTLFHNSLLEATGLGSSGFGSPDIIYSFAAYDVSQGPIRIHCVIPTDITYWSVSFYDMNSQNFFVENSLAAQSSELDLILAAQGVDSKLLLNEKVIPSSTKKGMIAIRAVISDRNNKAELGRITAAQKKSFIEPVL